MAPAALETGGEEGPDAKESPPRVPVTPEVGCESSEVEGDRLGTLVAAETEGHLSRTVGPAEAGGERSEVEGHLLRTLVTPETRGERSEVEEGHLGTSVTMETGEERSEVEEPHPRTLVAVVTGGERSEVEEHLPRTVGTVEMGGERSEVEEHLLRTVGTVEMGGQRSEVEEHSPRTFPAVEPGGQRSEVEERLSTSAPEMEVERSEVTPVPRSMFPAETGAEGPQAEEVQLPTDGGEMVGGSCSPSPLTGAGSPAGQAVPVPGGASRVSSPGNKQEPRQPATAQGPATRGRGRRPRRTADQDLVRGPGAPSQVQLAATVLRKVPGRVNVIVERREPAKR
eukprot:g19839.t1